MFPKFLTKIQAVRPETFGTNRPKLQICFFKKPFLPLFYRLISKN